MKVLRSWSFACTILTAFLLAFYGTVQAQVPSWEKDLVVTQTPCPCGVTCTCSPCECWAKVAPEMVLPQNPWDVQRGQGQTICVNGVCTPAAGTMFIGGGTGNCANGSCGIPANMMTQGTCLQPQTHQLTQQGQPFLLRQASPTRSFSQEMTTGQGFARRSGPVRTFFQSGGFFRRGGRMNGGGCPSCGG